MGLDEIIAENLKEIHETKYQLYLNEEQIRKNKVEESNQKWEIEKNEIIKQFDLNSNGILDIVENKDDFLSLIKSNQKLIQSKDTNIIYTQKFVKLNNYIYQKCQNLEDIFELLKSSFYARDVYKLKELLEEEIYIYNLLLFNSFNYVTSLLEDDMITFYDINEKLDSLQIFDSNWEKELSRKLGDIDSSIKKVSKSIDKLIGEVREVGIKISSSIDNLSYVTEESNRKLQSHLSDINSSIKVNNLFQLINTFQLRSISKSTKSLRD